MEKRILVIGAAFRDIFLYTGSEPKRGESVEGDNIVFSLGGKAANQAVAIAKLNEEVSFLGAVGEDEAGRLLIKNFEKHRVRINNLKIRPDMMSDAGVVLVLPDGQNKILTFSDAAKSITLKEVEQAFEEDFDAVIVLFELTDKCVLHACECAARKGIPVIVDAGPAKQFPLEKLAGIEIFSPNETEAEKLTGIELISREKKEEAAAILLHKVHAKYVVLKLGDSGSFIYDGNIFREVPARSVRAIDTTGAGDVFTAAMTVHYLNSHDIYRAVEFATKAASLSVCKTGAQTTFPVLEEINCEQM